jgi:hypothetical protein
MDIRSFDKPKGTVNNNIPPQNIDQQGKAQVTTHKESAPTTVMDDMSEEKVITEYLEYLKEYDISKEDIFTVLDTIITKGSVYWQFELLGKVPVVFKMRPAWVNEVLIEKIEKEYPKTVARFSDIVCRYNLAGSLVAYNKTDYEVKETGDLDRNLQFIMGLPFIMQNLLVKQMAIFDRVVAVATSDWAVENFSKPLSDE